MIWLVLLNNEGPGWEVPVDTMGRIDQVMVVIVIGLVVSVGLMLWDVVRHKLHLSVFTWSYFAYLLLSVGFFVFLLHVDAPSGQYWRERISPWCYSVSSRLE